MSHQKNRIHKTNFMISLLERAWNEGVAVSEKKFIAEICLKFGAGERYIKEILKQLEVLEILKIENGVILKGKKPMQTNLA